MGSSVSFSNASISSLAEKIADARRLYGSDSTYVIGMIAGLDLVLDAGDSDRLKRRLIEIEGGKASLSTPSTSKPSTPAKSSEAPAAASEKGEPGEPAESALTENSWIKGSVKWFNNDKGYGFISTASDTDVFVHWRDISSWDRSLGQGDEVEFMVTKTAKGFQAINVMKKEQGDSTTEPDGDPSDAQPEQEPTNEPEASESRSDSGTAPQASESDDGDEPAATPETECAADSTDVSTAAPTSDEDVSTGSDESPQSIAEEPVERGEPRGAADTPVPADSQTDGSAGESPGESPGEKL